MKLKTKIVLGSSAPLILVVILLTVTIQRIGQLLDAIHWVDHTHIVIGKASQMLGAAIDMETGLRGFFITGDEQFLEPYNWGKERFKMLQEDLTITVSDNPPLKWFYWGKSMSKSKIG